MNPKNTDQIYSYVNASGKTVYSNIKKETNIKVPPIQSPSFPHQQQEKPNTQIVQSQPVAKPVRLTADKGLRNLFGTIVVIVIIVMAFRLFLDNLERKFREKRCRKRSIRELQPEPRTVRPKPSWTLDFIQSLEWREFEKLCARTLQEKRCSTKLGTFGRKGDGGKDIHIYTEDQPGNLLGIAQCKAWEKIIPEKEMRDLLGAMTDAQTTNGIFFTSGEFSQKAREFGERNQVTMINGKGLLENIKQLPAVIQAEILNEIAKTDYTAPTCTICGIKMIKRDTRLTKNQFWGCVNYPRCKIKLPLRWTDKEE